MSFVRSKLSSAIRVCFDFPTDVQTCYTGRRLAAISESYVTEAPGVEPAFRLAFTTGYTSLHDRTPASRTSRDPGSPGPRTKLTLGPFHTTVVELVEAYYSTDTDLVRQQVGEAGKRLPPS